MIENLEFNKNSLNWLDLFLGRPPVHATANPRLQQGYPHNSNVVCFLIPIFPIPLFLPLFSCICKTPQSFQIEQWNPPSPSPRQKLQTQIEK